MNEKVQIKRKGANLIHESIVIRHDRNDSLFNSSSLNCKRYQTDAYIINSKRLMLLMLKQINRIYLTTCVLVLFSPAAPCAPQALSVNPLCDTEDVVVSWAPSNLSQSYYLTAIGQDGVSKNCTSTTENCTLSHLKCSQAYTVSVIASDGNCTSPASQALTFRTSETATSCLIS